MEGLNFENILDDEDVQSLFSDDDSTDTEEVEENEQEVNNETNIVEAEPDELFNSEEQPESVGNEKDTKKEKAPSRDEASPNFFSSIAESFVEEGLFPDLSEEVIKNIKTPQDLRNAVEEQIKAGLTEQEKRVAEALDNNVEPDIIKQYESYISYLGNISDDDISNENEEGEILRKRLIFQDYINKGFTEERAEKEVKRSFEASTDIEDAKDALSDMRKYYADSYKEVVRQKEEEKKQHEKRLKERTETIKKVILDEKNKLFGDIEIDQATRAKAFDAVSKPVHRDTKTGKYMTAMQKLQADNPEEFVAKMGLVYALTDGFTNLSKVVDKKVRKEVKKGFSDLERKINNTSRDSYGNLKFASGSTGSTFSDLVLDV